MSSSKQAGSVQADQIKRSEKDRAPAQTKEQKRDGKRKDDDIPGAEGPLSAGANEDTYD